MELEERPITVTALNTTAMENTNLYTNITHILSYGMAGRSGSCFHTSMVTNDNVFAGAYQHRFEEMEVCVHLHTWHL